MADMRQHRAIEQHLAMRLHQQRREVLDVFLAQQVRVVLDVDPRKGMSWPSPRQLQQLGPVLLAGIAPGGAEAGNQPGVGARQGGAQGGDVGTRYV